MPDNERDQTIETVAKVLHDHRLAHDSTGGFRGVLGGWNRSCICGWHGVDQEVDDHAFEHRVADKLAGLLRTGDDTDDEAEGSLFGNILKVALDDARAEVAKLRAERDQNDRACDWATYRKDYGPTDLTTAHKAFMAGWEAGRAHAEGKPADDSGALR